MTKKILSLVISLMMILPMLFVSVSAEVLTDGYITDLNVLQDYEGDTEPFAKGNGTFSIVEDEDNEQNMVLEAIPGNGSSSVILTANDTGLDEMDKFVFEFDVKKNYASAPIWVGLTHPQYGKYGFIMFPVHLLICSL